LNVQTVIYYWPVGQPLTDWYRLLIMVSGDFSQTSSIVRRIDSPKAR